MKTNEVNRHLRGLFWFLYLAGLVSMLIFALSTLTGCAGYCHLRTVSVEAEGVKYKSREFTPLVTVFKKGEADLVQSVTTEGKEGYSRAVGIKKVQSSGDAETMEATGETAGVIGSKLLKGK